MPTDDPCRPRAHEHGGDAEILLAQREQLRPHGAPEMRPFDHAEDEGNPEIDEDRTPSHRQDRRERHPQRQMGKRLYDLDEPLDQHVDRAAVIAGDAADHDTQGEADGDTHEADRERDPRAIDDARQKIAPEPVGAEQKQRAARGGAEKMQIAWEEAPEEIAIAVTEEAQRLHLAAILGIDAPQIPHVEVIVESVDIGRGESAIAEKMHRLRRRIDEIRMAGMMAVRCQKFAEGDREIHRNEQHSRDHGHAMTLQFPPHELPLRCHVEPLLLRRHRLDDMGIEGFGRYVVWQPLRSHAVRCVCGVGLHRVLPPVSRMRGSSAASARSESSIPRTVRSARNMRNEPARYISWLRSASSSIGPVVGRFITTETTVAPEMICGRSEPISAMNGLSASRKGYLTKARNGGSPLARAVITYCFCNSSSRLARRRRIMPAVPESPMTMTGIQR